MKVVELRGADKVFSNGMRGLAPIDLAVQPGEFVTLIGPSGCGKSTLLKLIANLLGPTAGEVAWWGENFGRVGEPGRRIAFVFQEPTLMPWSRVEANVRLPLDLAGIAPAEAAPRVAAALAQVELSGFLRHYPRQLSGGMRMRVSIARALVTEPALLLLDEPFAALDEITRSRLNDDLLKLRKSLSATIIFVTHSVYESVYLSTRITVMAARPGRVVADIPVDASHTRDEDFRLGPYYAERCRATSAALQTAMDCAP